ncbi:SGNH/GDSL hydrolase family protein [Streptomyces sp. NPDC048577]|uniref:SGNH/GDSL hydrolase family protein n=1 Tax=Streptomyces sp. NPDC048577 TaxID=3157209 RepID=UPI003445FAE8
MNGRGARALRDPADPPHPAHPEALTDRDVPYPDPHPRTAPAHAEGPTARSAAPARPPRIVRPANVVTPASCGLRTALDRLGRGYLEAGHEPVLVVPGDVASDQDTEQGRIITLPGLLPAPAVPPLRFAVLGDSLSEGVGDAVDGAWRGWAALLAEGLVGDGRTVDLRNLAVSGARSEDVEERQAPEALAFRPDLASVVVGVNDTLRRTFDIGRYARRLDRVCHDLAGLGTVLLTACLPDPGRMLGLPAPLARPLARRQRAVNTLVHALSARHDAVHLHLAGDTWTDDRSLWSADRLHPGERGHRAIAARFHALLAARGLAHGTPPSPEPCQPPPTRADTVRWLATAGTGWVARRCRDLLPQLLYLAAAETRHWADGTVARLDRRAEHALAAALAAVALDVPVATMGE